MFQQFNDKYGSSHNAKPSGYSRGQGKQQRLASHSALLPSPSPRSAEHPPPGRYGPHLTPPANVLLPVHTRHDPPRQGSDKGGLLVDVACILTHKKYQADRPAVIQRAKDAGVGVVIIPGMTVNSSRFASSIAKRNPGSVFYTAGIHPHNASSFNDQQLTALEDLVSEPACVGIGEIGLDFNRNFSPKDKQMECFEKQLELACKHDLPLVLHERDAYEEMMGLLVRYQPKLPPTLMHCFTGTREQALVYLAMGFYIGVTGHFVAQHEESGVKALLYADDIPLDKLLVETDGPFMFPQPERAIFRRGIVENVSPRAQLAWNKCGPGRNEPCTLPLIVELVAGSMKRPAPQVVAATTRNAMTFFRLYKQPVLNIREDI